MGSMVYTGLAMFLGTPVILAMLLIDPTQGISPLHNNTIGSMPSLHPSPEIPHTARILHLRHPVL